LRPTVVFLYAEHLNINATYTLLPREIAKRKDDAFIVSNVNRTDLSSVLSLIRNAKLVALDQSIDVCRGWSYPTGLSSRVHVGLKERGFYDDIYEAFLKAPGRTAYIGSGADLHWPGFNYDELCKRLDAIVWMFVKAPRIAEAMPRRFRDSWMDNHPHPSVIWEAIRDRVASRVEFMHCVDDSEIRREVYAKRWNAAIPGVPYRTRQIAEESIRATGLSIAPYQAYDARLTLLARTLPLNLDRQSRLWVGLRRINQRYIVRHSSVAFICGSGYGYPVRKFFEIPALQTPMIAYPCTGFRDIGFEHGKNCVEVMPEDAAQAAKELLRTPALAAKIVRAAVDLILREHTVSRRADQFIECLRHLAADRTITAEYRSGRFEIEFLN
jgi:glycosyltransferase involved in cell wall biosynthesis